MDTWPSPHIYYEFKSHDRYIPTAITIWRTALDNIGLQHVQVPEICTCLTHWGIDIDPKVLEGKQEELATQLALQVACGQLRYLDVKEYEGRDPDGTPHLKDYREYSRGGVRWPHFNRSRN